MYAMFLLCAIVGGVTLLIQFFLSMLGFMHIDMPDGLDAHGMDALHGLDVGHGMDIGHGMDVSHGMDSHVDMGVDIDSTTHMSLPATFGFLSFRAIIAALTFFGLTGLLMDSLEVVPLLGLLVAATAGFVAMASVAWILRTLYQLRADGTARIERSINHTASVYVPVPAEGEGKGKIQVNLQGRTMEYEAITAGKAIRSGDTVLITRVISSDTVEVEPAFDIEETS